HCREEIKMLDELVKNYDNVKVYKYEISDKDNAALLAKASEIYNTKIASVPFTVIGDKTFSGYSSENSKKKFIGAIEYYTKYGYHDSFADYLGFGQPSFEVDENAPDINEYLSDFGNYTFKLPIIGEVNTKDLALPLIAIVMGSIDGFNPCAMWILIFLITMLIGIKDKKRMWILGLSFIITSGVVYFLIMLAWLNIAVVAANIGIIRAIIGIVAIVGGVISLKGSLGKKELGCEVTNDKSRKKIMERIKKFTNEKSLVLALIGVITLAVSVNLIELACSLGFPVMFSQILAINNVNMVERIIYILISILFFLIDDIIIFIIAACSFKITAFSTKYARISKIIGGIILLGIGVLMILKPEWLMLNF
ncbi:MAG: hypothetical protein IJH34_10605, partial [Romboutsia sp.]|nr:hypothetical protein [Romboutsia sp.]